MRNAIIISLFIVMGILWSSCKEEKVYLPNKISEYVMYNDGATWIIVDSLYGNVDTLKLIEQSTYMQESGTYLYEHLAQRFKLIRNDSSEYFIMGSYEGFNDFYTMYFSMNNEIYYNHTSLFSNFYLDFEHLDWGSTIYSSQTINGTQYSDVILTKTINSNNDDTLKFWWVKNYGLVRSESISVAGNMTRLYTFTKVN